MFSIKSGLKDAYGVFKRNLNQILAFSFGWAVIISASIYFSFIYGLILIAVFLIFLPLELSLSMVSKKMYDNREVGNRDFYLGFKAIMISISLYSRVMLRGFLWAILAFVVVAGLGSVIVSLIYAPEFANLNDYQAILDAFLENKGLVKAVSMVSVISAFVSGLVYNLKSVKGHVAPYVLLDTGFDLQTSFKLSEGYTKKDKKAIALSKILFYVIYIVFILIGYVVYYLIARTPNYQMQNVPYAVFVGILVAIILIAPVRFISNFYYNSMYTYTYKDDAQKKLKDFINVRMRMQAGEFIKRTEEETKEEQEDKQEDDQDMQQ